MATTFHLGDCSTECDMCMVRCAERNHDGCIGTPEEQERANLLLEEDEPYATTGTLFDFEDFTLPGEER